MTRTFQDCTVDDCPRQVPDTGYVCTDCSARLTRNLALLLDEQAERAVVVIDRNDPDRGTRTTGLPRHELGLDHDLVDRMARPQTITATLPDGDRGPTRLPYTYRTAEARRDLLNTLRSNADHIAHLRGLARPLDTPHALAYWLTHQTTWLRHQPDGGDIIAELLDATRRAIQAVDNPPDRKYAGPCTATVPDDDGLAADCPGELYALPGHPRIECPDCGAQYDVTDRRAWLLDQADDMLLPATELARAIDGLGVLVTGSQIRGWRRRGLLANKGTETRPLYRVGDVRMLVVDRAVRVGATVRA